MTVGNTPADLANLSQALRNMVSTASHVVNAQEQNHAALNATTDSLAEFKKHLDTLSKNTKNSSTHLKQAEDLKKKELDLAKKKLEAEQEYQALVKSGSATQQQLAAAAANVTKAQTQHQAAVTKTTTSVQRLNTTAATPAARSLSTVSKSGTFANLMLVKFGDALGNQAAQLWAQYTANGGLMDATNTTLDNMLLGTDSWLLSMANQQNLALRYGLKGSELAEFASQNRQLFNSLGGTAQALDALNPLAESLRSATGSVAGDFELAIESANILAKQGVAVNEQNTLAHVESLKLLQTQAFMTKKQAQDALKALYEDVEVQDQLRSARKGERAAILESQRALYSQAIASGMSAEQAKQAAAMMNKMVSAKPLDRLKQAAKIRAVSGALGIAGGEQAAQAVTAGKRMTDQQRQQLMQFNQNAANAMDQMAGMGLGSEIFATSLMDKLDLDQYYGKGSPFSTTLGDELATPVKEVGSMVKQVNDTLEGKILVKLQELWNQAKILVSGEHWAGLLGLTVASVLGGKLVIGAVEGLAAKAMGMVGAGGAAGAVAGTTTAATTGGAAAAAGGAGALSTAGKVGSKIGAGAGAATGLALSAATLYAIDGIVGKFGFGKQVDTNQDEANWNRMGVLEKMESSLGRGIEKLGEFAMLDNIVSEARARRIDTETKYLDKHEQTTVQQVERPGQSKVKVEVVDTTNVDILAATKQTAVGIATQIKQNDTTSELLRSLRDLTEKQTTLMEKQLVAMTLTDAERVDTSVRSNLRRDNAFGARFNYV